MEKVLKEICEVSDIQPYSRTVMLQRIIFDERRDSCYINTMNGSNTSTCKIP
jgi:hypothetical protein